MQNWNEIVAQAYAAGIKVEVTDGIPTWEASPVLLHQTTIDRIRASIKPVGMGDGNCGCHHYADLSIRFAPNSHKRPDISIFCTIPAEKTTEVTLLPEAVVEILSEDYESKDFLVSVPFYRQIGIKDVIVLNPRTNEVFHYPKGLGEQRHTSPVTLNLFCGCTITV